MKNNDNLMYEARLALLSHPKCGAKRKQTTGLCRNPAMLNGRCRLHGGKSTGPKQKHGYYTNRQLERRRAIATLLR